MRTLWHTWNYNSRCWMHEICIRLSYPNIKKSLGRRSWRKIQSDNVFVIDGYLRKGQSVFLRDEDFMELLILQHLVCNPCTHRAYCFKKKSIPIWSWGWVGKITGIRHLITKWDFLKLLFILRLWVLFLHVCMCYYLDTWYP